MRRIRNRRYRRARWGGVLTALVAVGLLGSAVPAAAQSYSLESLQAEQPFVAPGNLFAISVPSGWQAFSHPDDSATVEFRAVEHPGDARLLIRRFSVPVGASPRHIVSVGIEQRISKLPMVTLVGRRDRKVAGHGAASVVATYKYQGNIQYPRAREETVVVVGNEAYLFIFDCIEGAASRLIMDVETFYRTFAPRPPGLRSEGFSESQPAPFTF